MRRHIDPRLIRHGLTLLELMLAMVLMAVIMTMTWSLLGIFRDRLETSQQQTEQWQLVRSLQRVLADDLCSCEMPARRGAPHADGRDGGASASSTSRSDAREESAPPAPRALNNDNPAQYAANASTQADALQDPLRPSSAADRTTPLDSSTGLGATASSSDADAVVRGAWLEPQSFLLGTSQALMFDVIPAATPQEPLPPTEEPLLDQATIPDTVRRVVYAFHDPPTAARMDRLPGLVRCELTMWQLTHLRQQVSGDADLLSWLRPAIQGAHQPGDQLLTPPAADASPTADDPSPRPTGKNPLDELNNSAALVPGVDLHLDEHLDYVAELATFLLRYYDGTSWQSQWDSRQRGQLPVAIELRFQLTGELPPTPADGAEVPAEFGDEMQSAASALTNPPPTGLEPMDDGLRSAQTRPPQDHRFVIFLHPPADSAGRDSDPPEGSPASPTADSDSDLDTSNQRRLRPNPGPGTTTP